MSDQKYEVTIRPISSSESGCGSVFMGIYLLGTVGAFMFIHSTLAAPDDSIAAQVIAAALWPLIFVVGAFKAVRGA